MIQQVISNHLSNRQFPALAVGRGEEGVCGGVIRDARAVPEELLAHARARGDVAEQHRFRERGGILEVATAVPRGVFLDAGEGREYNKFE